MCVRFGITTNALVIGSLGKPTNEPPAPVSVGSVADVSPHPLLLQYFFFVCVCFSVRLGL